MHLLDEARSEFTLGPAIKSGGEGAVHSIAGRTDVVAKIYHTPPDDARIAKLRAMLAQVSPKLLEAAAWPQSLLHDGGQYRGFLMARVVGEEIHQLFNPGERARKFPDRRWDFLIHVARNCADAFDALHGANVVMGDVNEANLLVLPNGCVRLIDCDSYQIAREGRVFTCDVGVDQWIPPELQAAPTLRNVIRSKNHDLFGLAVLIFKLIFMGRHPYAGVPLNPGEFELEQAIREYRFAFSPSAHAFGMRPPPHSLLLDKFPQSVTKMFESAFMRGSDWPDARPSATRWVSALEVISRHLKECEQRRWHLFTANLGTNCPWCEIQTKGGPDHFESVAIASAMPPVAQKGGLWERIESVEEIALQVPTFEAVQVPVCVAQPFPAEAMGTRGTFVGGWFTIAASVVAAPFTGGASLFGTLAGVGLLSGGSRTDAFNAEVARRRNALSAAESQLRATLELFSKIRTDYLDRSRRKRKGLQASYYSLRSLSDERQRDFKRLQSNIHERCLQAHLAKHFIARTSITGIGASRTALLISHGIETARDVHPNINVPGFGPVLVSNLMAWRDGLARYFHLPANAQIPQQDIAQLDARFLARQRVLEKELQAAPEELADLNLGVLIQHDSIQRQLATVLGELGQARANVSVIPS